MRSSSESRANLHHASGLILRPMQSLYDDIAGAASEKTAIVFQRQRLSYAEFLARIERFAAHLQARGVAASDRVGVTRLERPDYLAAVYGCAKIGAAAVPVPANDPCRA